MPETTGDPAAQGEAGAEAQGATGAPPQGGSSQDAQGASGGEGTGTVEALTSKIADLERDNAAYRKRERDRERAEAAKADSEKSEVERLRSENERLKADLSERDTRDRGRALSAASVAAATKLGFRNPSAATKLLRADDPDVKWDDEGEPTNVEALLAAWAKDNPYAIASADFGGGNRGQSAASGTPDMNALIRGAAAGSKAARG